MAPPPGLVRATDGFLRAAETVRPDQWALPTPCDGWTVREVVGHVAAGSRMVATLAAGGSRDDAIAVLGTDHLGDDPIAALRAALDEQLAAFAEPDVLDRVFSHPAGDLPGALMLQFRLTDLVVHQWDVARAIGADETLDPVLTDELWASIEPMAPMMAASGVFGAGASGELGPDASSGLRILDAAGRRP